MEELQLIESIRQEDDNAIKALYNTYARELCYIAKRWVDDEDEVEDIVGNSFLAFISQVREKKVNITQSPNIKGLLYIIVRNQSIDFIRDKKRREKIISESVYIKNIENDNIEWTQRQAYILEKLYKEIENLPKRRKEIIKMLVFQKLTLEEIAKQQGVSYNTVKNQKNKALEALRLAFSNDELKIILLLLSASAFSLN